MDNGDATPIKHGLKPSQAPTWLIWVEKQSSEFQLLLSPLLVNRLGLKDSGL
jgi:hypothetical protein